MLKIRVIPTLLYRDYGLVKGEAFDCGRHIGHPLQAIKVYELRGVDELVFLDVTATLEGRSPDFALVDELADDCFMPLAVGGGVRSVADVARLLAVGADKVVINTVLVEDPEVVEHAAQRFGSQCVIASIDTRAAPNGGSEVWIRSGTVPTGRDAVDVAHRAEERGAGEILLTSIERDGTMTGYDLPTIRRVAEAVSIPVIASGGAGSPADMARALEESAAAAVAAAAMFHFTHHTPRDVKDYLAARGHPVRR